MTAKRTFKALHKLGVHRSANRMLCMQKVCLQSCQNYTGAGYDEMR